MLIVEGVEADDVIATPGRSRQARGWRTVISTGDKDFAQLVDAARLLVNTMSNELLDRGSEEQVRRPAREVSRLPDADRRSDRQHSGRRQGGAQDGCQVDREVRLLEGVLAHADEITGLAGENLRKMRDWLPKAREPS